MTRCIDLTGLKFNKLLVLQRAEDNRYKHASWLCRCDCGNLTTVVGKNLRNGGTKSCGCSKGEFISNALSGLPSQYPEEYISYHAMIRRCLNENAEEYKNYGEKGISICFRWLGSFENFLKDMGPRPPGTTIDRIDFNGNYEPGNCRWATIIEQNRNKSTNVVITYKGITMLAIDWSIVLNIDNRKLKDYLKYCIDFEDFLIRYGFFEKVSNIIKEPKFLNIKETGKYKEFDGYKRI